MLQRYNWKVINASRPKSINPVTRFQAEKNVEQFHAKSCRFCRSQLCHRCVREQVKRWERMRCYTLARMDVTVVIPAFNEARYLAACLTCLTKQTIPSDRFSVIVVDNGSTDETASIAESFHDRLRLRVVSRPKVSVSAVRNFGASLATSELLTFLDADCLVQPNWLSRSLELGPEHGLWGAHYVVPKDATWVGRIWSIYQAKELGGPVTFLPGCNMFIRQSEFRLLGGFNERIQTSEDVEFCMRVRAAQMPVLAFPELATIHLGTPRTLKHFYRQNRWHGKDVLPNFLANLPSKANLPLVAVSIYTFAFFWLTTLALLGGLFWHVWWPVLLFAGFFFLPPLGLAIWKAKSFHFVSNVAPLFALYLVYLMARAAALKSVFSVGTFAGHRRA